MNAAWRVPAVWLIAVLPASAVVAGFVTLGLAVRSGADASIGDDVRRTAQVQDTELGPDLAARSLGLTAIASLHDGVLEILPARGDFGSAVPTLTLRHPADAAQDLRVVPVAAGSGWRMPAPPVAHDWLLQLTAADGSWRLVGRLVRGERAAALVPVFADGA